MNYREQFKRYKEGLLNDEETALIKQEIDKFEALEAYLSEVLDEELDLIANVNLEYEKEETDKLKKSVNSKLRKVVISSILIVTVFYIGVFYVASDIVDRAYYDPTDVTQSVKQSYQSPDFFYDMQAYVSLNMPGYSSNSFTIQEPKGFGKYETSYSLRNLFTKNEQRYFVNLSRNQLSFTMDGIFSNESLFGIWAGFERIKRNYFASASEDTFEEVTNLMDNDIQQKNEVTVKYLKELNPLSYISMSIVFDKDLTMEEFYKMNEAYSALDFKWVGIRTVEPDTRWHDPQPMHLIGFNPNYNDEPSSNRQPDADLYPLFYLMNMHDDPVLKKKDYPEAIIEAYRIHFKSRLKYMRNQESFVSIFDYNNLKTNFYEDALDYIEKNGVKTYGVLVFGTAEELLKRIDEIPYDSLYINEVLPTNPNIYHN